MMEEQSKIENEDNVKPGGGLDEIMAELGPFGKFQLRTIAVTILVAIFTGCYVNEFVFVAARIKSRCIIPECDSENPEFAPPWILNAVPGTDAGLQSCQRYSNISSTLVDNSTCPAEWFDRDSVQECNDNVYENTNTIVYDFNLGCDEWRRSFIGSTQTIGKTISLPLIGLMSDRWGRRIALTFAAFNTGWVGLIRCFSNSYTTFVVLEIIQAILGAGAQTCAFILVLELAGTKYRTIAGAIFKTFGSVGQLVLGFLSWGIPNWRYLTLATHVPQLLTFLYFFILPESVRWYLAKGKFDKAEETLKKCARVNGKELSEKSLQALKRDIEERKRPQASDEAPKTNETWLIIQVFQHKQILLRCIATSFWWISDTMIYYGLTINAVHISGHTHINYIAVTTIAIPGFWVGLFLINRIGRRPVVSGSFFFCACCQIGYIFIPTGHQAASLSLYLIGKLCASIASISLYTYTAELFPTKHRNTLFAFSSMVGRIGAFVAPLTPALAATVWEHLPFTLFAACGMISSVLVLLTPETRGTVLPDTMEEASNMGTRK